MKLKDYQEGEQAAGTSRGQVGRITVVSAWVITIPASAVLGAVLLRAPRDVARRDTGRAGAPAGRMRT